MDENVLTLEIRREIYNLVLKYPGLHLREISRRMYIPFSTLKYHLDYLEKHEILHGKSDGRYIRYYVEYKVGRREKQILNLLRLDTPRNIILYLLIHLYSSQIDISGSLGKHPTTIEFHLKKLLEMDIITPVEVKDGKVYREIKPKVVECSPVGKEKIYVLKDPQVIYDLLITYKYSLIEDITGGLFLDFLDYFISDGVPEHVINPKDMTDSVIEVFFEIFPHPYHA